jgi:hypothetical protein
MNHFSAVKIRRHQRAADISGSQSGAFTEIIDFFGVRFAKVGGTITFI